MLFRIFPIDDHQTRSCSSSAPETRSLRTTPFYLKTIETEQRGGGEGIKRTLVMWTKTTFPQNRIVHASGGNFSRFSRVITCPRLRQPEDPLRGVPIFSLFCFSPTKYSVGQRDVLYDAARLTMQVRPIFTDILLPIPISPWLFPIFPRFFVISNRQEG